MPPLGRSLVFAKADAWLELDGNVWSLCSNRWSGGIIHPAGHIHIESFRTSKQRCWRPAARRC